MRLSPVNVFQLIWQNSPKSTNGPKNVNTLTDTGKELPSLIVSHLRFTLKEGWVFSQPEATL